VQHASVELSRSDWCGRLAVCDCSRWQLGITFREAHGRERIAGAPWTMPCAVATFTSARFHEGGL